MWILFIFSTEARNVDDVFLNQNETYGSVRYMSQIMIVTFCESAVLITGGIGTFNGGIERTAEIFLPKSKSSCKLPGLPIGRKKHTNDNGLLCGGEYHDGLLEASRTCVLWSPESGTWNKSHTLTEDPENYHGDHVSWTPTYTWTPPLGTYLLGGWTNRRWDSKF